ncbi:MAG: Ku protein [Myxococcales bacterium]|nr:Ku protein [Myxococcales bacterium]
MAPRAIASGTVSFGLVSIPVKVFTATSPQKVYFNMLEAGTGARPKQQYVSSVTGEVLDRKDMVKGYEYARGQYVQLSPDELKALEADRTGGIDIVEFVPLEAIDLVQIEKSYYLGPDKGGDKAYHLLAAAMRRKDVVAVARWAAKGKEQLVLVRPYHDGLILHQLFYANEVRAFEDLDVGASGTFADVELDLADKLIDQLSSDEFDPEAYEDSYTVRVRELIDQKVAGEEITTAVEQPKAQIIDLFEALKQSLDGGGAAEAAEPKATKKKTKANKEEEVEPRPPKKAVPRKQSRSKKSSTG